MLERVFELEGKLPEWLRPTYRGAIFIFGMGSGVAGKLFVAAILASLMLQVGSAPGLLLFSALLAVAVVAGAVGGTIHGALKALDSGGTMGTWLRWTAAMFGYMAAFVLLTPKGPFSLNEPTFYPFAAGSCALAAAVLVLLDDRRPGRPTPREFHLLQNRKRLWASTLRMRARMHARMAEAGGPR